MRARPGTAAASGSAPEGFADVYERYFADIYRYIAGRLGRNVADDVLEGQRLHDHLRPQDLCAAGHELDRRYRAHEGTHNGKVVLKTAIVDGTPPLP